MKIKVIGCGNAFSKVNGNQCFMCTENDRNLFIDFGVKIPNQLNKLNIPFTEIDDVYISHLHGDHIGGLEELAFTRYDWLNRSRHIKDWKAKVPPPVLYGNVDLIYDLWNKSLRGGLESMEGFVATIDTFFDVRRIEPNTKFEWQEWKCQPIQQIHIMSGSTIMNTFGLLMKRPNHKTVYFTTDSQHCSPRQMEIFYKDADIIFQDCELTPFYSGVHANYEQLAGYEKANSVKLEDSIKNKMWLSHYQDFYNDNQDFYGNFCDWDKKSLDDGFNGFVKVEQVFDTETDLD